MKIEDLSKFGFESNGIRNFTPLETYELCQQGAVLIDVREDYLSAFKKFSVPVFFEIPLSQLETHLSDFNAEDIYIFADSAGIRSKEAVIILMNAGFTNVFNLAGGIVDWEKANVPLIVDKTEMMSGSCACQLKYRNINDKKNEII
jgi:rhodanese-related sulfurtransferase